MADEIICEKCGRVALRHTGHGNITLAAYAYVVHDYYGCDSGCCGHTAYLCDADGNIIDQHFRFAHPDENKEDFCRAFVDQFWPGIECRLIECQVSDE